MARFIDSGGPPRTNETRETLVERVRLPKKKARLGHMWVVKTAAHGILAHCLACGADEVFVHHWQKREWAGGMTEPVAVDFDGQDITR